MFKITEEKKPTSRLTQRQEQEDKSHIGRLVRRLVENKIYFIVLIVPALALAVFFKTQTPDVCFKSKCINVEVANTLEERKEGLMFKQNLEENEGMLFIFEKEEKHPFWMKNTLIPLDIIWINKGMEIVEIRSVFPCEKEPCETYRPKNNSMYVVEVNYGFTEENNVKEGDRVIIDVTAITSKL